MKIEVMKSNDSYEVQVTIAGEQNTYFRSNRDSADNLATALRMTHALNFNAMRKVIQFILSSYTFDEFVMDLHEVGIPAYGSYADEKWRKLQTAPITFIVCDITDGDKLLTLINRRAFN